MTHYTELKKWSKKQQEIQDVAESAVWFYDDIKLEGKAIRASFTHFDIKEELCGYNRKISLFSYHYIWCKLTSVFSDYKRFRVSNVGSWWTIIDLKENRKKN